MNRIHPLLICLNLLAGCRYIRLPVWLDVDTQHPTDVADDEPRVTLKSHYADAGISLLDIQHDQITDEY